MDKLYPDPPDIVSSSTTLRHVEVRIGPPISLEVDDPRAPPNCSRPQNPNQLSPETARSFWVQADVDRIFDAVRLHVEWLHRCLKDKTATHADHVQGLKLLKLVEEGQNLGPPELSSVDNFRWSSVDNTEVLPTSSVSASQEQQEVVPASQEEQEEVPASQEEQEEVPASQEEPEEAPVSQEEEQVSQAIYKPHQCTAACVPHLPRTGQPFWGQNPLRVPLLCGFKRLGPKEVTSGKPVYVAPCRRRLRSRNDVMRFLFATESFDILQVEFFTFSTVVQLYSPPVVGPRLPELDLSRGLEPSPVELCLSKTGARPRDFRYRKDRWPHGCFLSPGPALFDTCCDCPDGCLDARRCACRGRSSGGRHYTNHMLLHPLKSGLFECGPWCGCNRARCQNRLVQSGVRVRLQVFQSASGRGWGVRCRDDLERGTFICTYAGLVLSKWCDPGEATPPKLLGAEPPSDDDVEVISEWLTPSLCGPVIQILQDSPQKKTQTKKTENQGGCLATGAPSPEGGAGQSAVDKEGVAKATGVRRPREAEPEGLMRKRRRGEDEEVYYLDATKEGNVARFLNHSCHPNLFTQSVFTDTQDPGFPLIAFFTRRMIKAGTELTWKCSPDTGSSPPRQEVLLLDRNGCASVGTKTAWESPTASRQCEVCDVHEGLHENGSGQKV